MTGNKRKHSDKDTATEKKLKSLNGSGDKANGDTTWTHWLMKSEPESRLENGIDVKFGIEDLKKEPNQTACWDGVRNYQARNFMKQMKKGQRAFFYHSNCKPPGMPFIKKPLATKALNMNLSHFWYTLVLKSTIYF